MTGTATLITQLRILGQLTRTEAQVARQRVVQASTSAVRDDLRQNAAEADGRAARIADALRGLGALPDLVTPLLGRVAVLVRGAMEQAQPLDEALLGDLALEHHLRDRARYVAALAATADVSAVQTLAGELEAAHDETVRWLTSVLADLAGGQAALEASPLQRVAAQVTRAANAPSRPALDDVGAMVTRTVETVTAVGKGVGTDVKDTAEQYAARLGAEAAAQTAGQLARHRPGSGPPDTPEPAAPADDTELVAPPIPGFAELPPHAAVAALRTLDDPRAVAAMLEFEQAHGDRPGVVAAARLRATAVRTG